MAQQDADDCISHWLTPFVPPFGRHRDAMPWCQTVASRSEQGSIVPTCDRLGGMTDTNLLIALVIWLVSAVGSFLIASQRGDPNPGTWGVVGFLLGPVGLLMTGVMVKTPAYGDRICANCGKGIAPDRTRLCNHCGQPFA